MPNVPTSLTLRNAGMFGAGKKQRFALPQALLERASAPTGVSPKRKGPDRAPLKKNAKRESYSNVTTTMDFAGSSTRSSSPFRVALNGAGFTTSGLSTVL